MCSVVCIAYVKGKKSETDNHETNLAIHFDILLQYVSTFEGEKERRNEEQMVSAWSLPIVLQHWKFLSVMYKKKSIKSQHFAIYTRLGP
jgi:hypothetical protein